MFVRRTFPLPMTPAKILATCLLACAVTWALCACSSAQPDVAPQASGPPPQASALMSDAEIARIALWRLEIDSSDFEDDLPSVDQLRIGKPISCYILDSSGHCALQDFALYPVYEENFLRAIVSLPTIETSLDGSTPQVAIGHDASFQALLAQKPCLYLVYFPGAPYGPEDWLLTSDGNGVLLPNPNVSQLTSGITSEELVEMLPDLCEFTSQTK